MSIIVFNKRTDNQTLVRCRLVIADHIIKETQYHNLPINHLYEALSALSLRKTN